MDIVENRLLNDFGTFVASEFAAVLAVSPVDADVTCIFPRSALPKRLTAASTSRAD